MNLAVFMLCILVPSMLIGVFGFFSGVDYERRRARHRVELRELLRRAAPMPRGVVDLDEYRRRSVRRRGRSSL